MATNLLRRNIVIAWWSQWKNKITTACISSIWQKPGKHNYNGLHLLNAAWTTRNWTIRQCDISFSSKICLFDVILGPHLLVREWNNALGNMKHICWHCHADILCALYYQVHRYLEVQFPGILAWSITY